MKKRYLLLLLLPFFGLLYFIKPETGQDLSPITEEKPFVIIVPSFNNAPYLEKTLQSIFSQKYENYKVIYIDDHSFDDSFQKAEYWIGQLDRKKRTTLIQNPSNLGATANFYTAAQLCQNHEILVLLDGDDCLAHEEVLSLLNRAYANPHTWMTYGGSLDYPQYEKKPLEKKLPSKLFRASSFRKYPAVPPHLTTGYAALFKQIHIEDLFYRGHFFPMGSEYAFLYPLLEMAGKHSLYSEKPLYLKNTQNPLSETILLGNFQQECLEYLRSRPRYAALNELPLPEASTKTADLIIFSSDNPLQLCALLESIDSHVKGLNKITILYRSSSSDFESGYLELKLDYPQITFISYAHNFQALFQKTLFDSPLTQSPYILFAKDTLIIQRPVDLVHCITLLESTHAYGVYLDHHLNLKFSSLLNRFEPVPPRCPLLDAYAWQFSSGMDDWNTPQNLNFSLYRKQDLKRVFTSATFTTPETFLEEWGPHISESKVGLFFADPHCFNLVSDQTPKDLLKKFHAGLKLDLSLFSPLQPESQEISSNFSFIHK